VTRRHGILQALVASGIATLALVTVVPRATAIDPDPFAITTVSAEAGYFRLDGGCPKNTTKLKFSWSPSPSGDGWGEVAIQYKLPISIPLRMQASSPVELISVTIECKTQGGKTRLTYGPVSLLSGSGLLPLPPTDTGTGRRVVYSLSAQQLWAFEADDSVGRTYLVSGRRLALVGRGSQVGSFKVFSKSVVGCVGGIRCPHMVRFNRTSLNNIGFHAIPWSKPKGLWQTQQELGQPRSGGCVRARPEDAEWLFNWAVKGDKVFVIT